MQLREKIKRSLPEFLLGPLRHIKGQLGPLPLEDIVLHGYSTTIDGAAKPRLNLIIPTIAPEKAFGGVTTGLDIFLELGKRANSDLRIILDDIGEVPRGNLVANQARNAGVNPNVIQIVPRTTDVPRLDVRERDVFLVYNWWTALNAKQLLKFQTGHFGRAAAPLLYLIQEYEPHFYEFSSTHMLARQAFSPDFPCWGIFNSGELYRYFCAQGHHLEHSITFEPHLNECLKAILKKGPLNKSKRIVIYGRPGISRNCYPAIEKGMREWAARFPEFANWEILSAGTLHRPLRLSATQTIQSLGKLSMEQYGDLLLSAAVGLALMSSPHPSYPPLEMAHFGLLTVTNTYHSKDLAQSHENIISIDNIAPDTIANALAGACRRFESDQQCGWHGKTYRPSFLEDGDFAFLDQLSNAFTRCGAMTPRHI